MKRLHLILVAALMFGGGCMVHGSVRTRAYVQPELVYVSPGVQVVYDYHEPVFYSDGYYWRYYGNVWYRSSYHSHGWVRWRNVPRAVVSIDRPHTYVRYRVRGNAGGRSKVRDNRVERREDRRERREDRRERKEDRREKVEDHRERKEDRREKREDKREKREDKRDRNKVRDHRR